MVAGQGHCSASRKQGSYKAAGYPKYSGGHDNLPRYIKKYFVQFARDDFGQVIEDKYLDTVLCVTLFTNVRVCNAGKYAMLASCPASCKDGYSYSRKQNRPPPVDACQCMSINLSSTFSQDMLF